MHPDWRTMTGPELDRQYITRLAVPDWASYLERWKTGSVAYRSAHPAHLDVAYGADPKEKLDVFVPERHAPGRPVHVLIHGGYWRALDKDEYAIAGAPGIERGAVTVQVNYALCPQAALSAIVEQCRRALAWVARHIGAYGGDPGNVYVSGHSAGGHLSAMMLATDWRARGLEALRIRAICPLSGLYDLAPLQRVSLQQDLRLTEEEVRTLSPCLLPIPQPARVLMTVGSLESAEFHRQFETYAAHARGAGLPVEAMELEGRHHYSMVDAFCDPDHPLCARWLDIVHGQAPAY